MKLASPRSPADCGPPWSPRLIYALAMFGVVHVTIPVAKPASLQSQLDPGRPHMGRSALPLDADAARQSG